MNPYRTSHDELENWWRSRDTAGEGQGMLLVLPLKQDQQDKALRSW